MEWSLKRPEKNKALILPEHIFSSLKARRRKDWDQLFLKAPQNFQGADMNLSMPWKKGKSLWLFGDTLVGKRNPPDFVMPRNCVGIVNQNGKNREKPSIEFFWNEKNGKPISLLPPVRSGEWIWPGTFFKIEKKLYFFLHRFQYMTKGNKWGFNFDYTGFVIYRVENPLALPSDWEIVKLKNSNLAHSVYWGISSVTGKDGYVYQMGTARGSRKHGTLLARCPFEELIKGEVKNWEYYFNNESGEGWKKDSTKLTPLFEDSTYEMSIHFIKEKKAWLIVYGLRKSQIGIRTAPSLTGPWSPFVEIYDPPDPGWHADYFSYAPKGHPELQTDQNELLLTYITNSMKIEDLFEDQRIYYPKFLSLKYK